MLNNILYGTALAFVRPVIKINTENPHARSVLLIPRPCETQYPPGNYLNCQDSLFPGCKV